MSLWQKIKALWEARKVVNSMDGIKRGWKTLSFWITLLGNLIALASAIKGIVPATVAVIVGASLTALYNILRGAKKSQEAGVIGWWKTSEFWLSVGTLVSQALIEIQGGGVSAAWITTVNSVLAAAMALARDLANKQPQTPAPAPVTQP